MTEEQKKEKLQRVIGEFCSKPENAKIVEFIRKGTYNISTEEFTLTGDTGNKLIFKIDDLSNNTVDFSPLFQNNEIKLEEPNIGSNVIDNNIKDNQTQPLNNNDINDEIEEILDDNIGVNTVKPVPTLYDLNKAVEEKNVGKIDELLSTLYINPNTGLVDIGNAIQSITTETFNEAIKCVKNNTTFSTDLSHYDLQGNSIKAQDKLVENVNAADICDKSFNNILVCIRAAKLKGIIYDEDKPKVAYTTLFNDKLNVLGLNTHNTNEKDNIIEFNNEISKEKELSLKPTMDLKKAGFADIFILTIIVIVYAIIIINLILKLK